MLRYKIFVAILGLAGVGFAASAQGQVFVGGAFGTAKKQMDCSWLGSCYSSDGSFKIIGGYSVDKAFAIEVNYFSLGGEVGHTFFGDTIYRNTWKSENSGISLAAVGNHSFGDKFGSFAKIGVANIRTKHHASVVTINDQTVFYSPPYARTESHLLLGFGLNYKLSEQLTLRGEVEQFRPASQLGRGAHRNISVGLQYGF